MKKTWKEKSWKEKKKSFRLGTFIFLFFFAFSFFTAPEYKKEQLTYKTIVLKKKPEFIKNCGGKSGCHYSLKLKANLKVVGIDYKYLKHRKFKQSVKVGDTLKVGILGDKVLTLRKHNTEYLQFEKAQFHKQQNDLYIRFLSLTGIVVCLIPLFFNKTPQIDLFGEKQEINFAKLLVFGLLTCFILLLVFVGFTFISGSEFVR